MHEKLAELSDIGLRSFGLLVTICSGKISINAILFLASPGFLVSRLSVSLSFPFSNSAAFSASTLSCLFCSFTVTSLYSSHLTDPTLEDDEAPDIPDEVDIGLRDEAAETAEPDLPRPIPETGGQRRSSALAVEAEDADNLLAFVPENTLAVPNLRLEGKPIPSMLAFLFVGSSIFGCKVACGCSCCSLPLT